MSSIQKLRFYGRFDITLLLAAMSVFRFLLSIFRFFVTDTKLFLFLNWNLFLAFIPWLTSSFMIINPQYQHRKLFVCVLFVLWIIFFPNSPYILTDLFHLRMKSSAPIWFDLILILSFAWTGLLFGFISLLDIEQLLSKYFKKKTIHILASLLLFAGSFGIYLGRYLRWNSWDLLKNPGSLLYDISDRFTNPMIHPRTWGITILMGLLLNIIYWSIKLLTRHYNSPLTTGAAT
jgi:uncharacterized membrane protein